MATSKTETLVFNIENSGERLDKFLGGHTKIGSRSRAAQLIDLKLVQVNQKPAKASLVLKKDDKVEVQLPVESAPSELQPYDLTLDIVFEDEHLLVINKPAGLVVHPAAGHASKTLVNALLHHTDDLAIGFGEARPGIVHRLDKDTSGLLVVAKTDEAHQSLAKQFRQKTTHRIYWAICYGVFKDVAGTFQSYLARHPTNRKKFASTKATSKGRLAITHYQQIDFFQKECALLKLKLETGRTHQIRIHLSESGHPIVGDTLYCSESRLKAVKNSSIKKTIQDMQRFALHAAELGFIHPVNQKQMHFSIGWPNDLLPLVTALNFSKDTK